MTTFAAVSKEAIDEMRSGDWLGLEPSVAFGTGSKANGLVLVEREPDHVLLAGLRVGAWSDLIRIAELH